MTEPTRMCGRYIHMAAHAIQTIRDTALDQSGVSFTQWKVLDKAPGTNRDELIHKLAELTVDNEGATTQAIDALHEQRLIMTSEQSTFELTPQGHALCQQINAIRTELHHQLYDGITAEDLDVTMRVLNLITERARSVRAEQ